MRAAVPAAVLSPEQKRIADAGLKTLMPVADGKTLLDLSIDSLRSAGFDELCLVIGPEHDEVRDFCAAKGFDVDFAVQNKPLGTADAVLAAEVCVKPDEFFLVVNSDNLYPVMSLRRLREANRPAMLAFQRESLIEQSSIPEERIAKFATVEVDSQGFLRRIVEKPQAIAPGSFISMNAWLFSHRIFDACRAIGPSERGEYELASAVQYAIDELGEKFLAIKTNEGVLDLSSRSDIETVSRLLKERNQSV